LTKGEDKDEEEGEQDEIFDRLLKKRSEETANYNSARPGTPALGRGAVAIPNSFEGSIAAIPEKPEYHEQFFWKTSLIETSSIDDLLKDYEW